MPLNEYEFPTNKIANVQAQLERLVEKNYYLHQSARDAYRAYLLAYNSHSLKEIFNVHRLDLAVRTHTHTHTHMVYCSPSALCNRHSYTQQPSQAHTQRSPLAVA